MEEVVGGDSKSRSTREAGLKYMYQVLNTSIDDGGLWYNTNHCVHTDPPELQVPGSYLVGPRELSKI